jgi:hypothetical protein
MSRARLRRLERATTRTENNTLTDFGTLPDLPLPDDDTANPTYQPVPKEGPTYTIKPNTQAEVLRMPEKGVA